MITNKEADDCKELRTESEMTTRRDSGSPWFPSLLQRSD